MSIYRKVRVVTHRYGEKHNAVVYRLRRLPEGASKGELTACVQVLPEGTVEKRELAEKIAIASVGLNARTVEYVLDLMRDVILAELKAGRHVSMEDFLTFGAALTGKVSPERPLDVKHLPLASWARFSKVFTDELNRNAAIRYAEPLQPTEVKVKSVERLGDNTFEASGKFHNIQSLTVDLIAGEATIPCAFHLAQSPKSKRNIGTTLVIVPTQSPANLPAAPQSLTFTWLDATATLRTHTHPLS